MCKSTSILNLNHHRHITPGPRPSAISQFSLDLIFLGLPLLGKFITKIAQSRLDVGAIVDQAKNVLDARTATGEGLAEMCTYSLCNTIYLSELQICAEMTEIRQATPRLRLFGRTSLFEQNLTVKPDLERQKNVCPIKSMPLDILELFFEFVRGEDYGKPFYRGTPQRHLVPRSLSWVALSHVCHYWSEGAIGIKNSGASYKSAGPPNPISSVKPQLSCSRFT